MKSQPILLSGIQPSGDLHIGNYLGAIKQWVELQKTHHIFIAIVDLHAITVPQDPEKLHTKTLETAALLSACGIDPKKSVLFIQSHVPAHTELAWILNTITPVGELFRMTQYKEKAGKLKTKIKAGIRPLLSPTPEIDLEESELGYAGLLNYPVLQAADILLYQPDIVPVGEDQLQHLELTRALARRFNNRFGNTFKEPQQSVNIGTERIMGLDDPSKKMSKSASSPNNYIALLDSPKEILRKIKIAVTDSGKEIKYDPAEKPAISNLMSIYSAFSGLSLADIGKKYHGKGYGEFKKDLGEILVKKLSPIQKKYLELSKNKKSLLATLNSGSQKAARVANQTLSVVKERVGLVL